MTESLIHLRVQAATKGRWVRASRAAGMRLTDYIASAVEAYMQQQIARVAIPEELDFSDLRLARETDGSVSFDWAVIERICTASGLPVELLRDGPEDNVAGLVISWYQAHRQRGGATDPVAEDLLSEVRAEEAVGQHVSHVPGRA
ncbi:hypothetical protein SAMN05216577_111128 [Pseudomonas citronellolis]|uniref:Uncharacterized protein n=1 Tax=Pseudomonas citronellolis TaxID=53408 RepID=A0AAQ1KFL8_9PSED|nr:hypothetical protein [Pseudomonas citronellolis]SFC85314.1 hypothetical protein SAMN05216577_111128 [Pseudomonas citronellolis]